MEVNKEKYKITLGKGTPTVMVSNNATKSVIQLLGIKKESG